MLAFVKLSILDLDIVARLVEDGEALDEVIFIILTLYLELFLSLWMVT